MLKKASPLIAFGLLLMFASSLGSTDMRAPKPKSAAEIATATEQLENVIVVGRVIARKPSKTGSGVVLTLEGKDGFQFSAYLSPDVQHIPLELGNTVSVIGTSIAKGALAVTKREGVRKLKPKESGRPLGNVVVSGGFATWNEGMRVRRVSSKLPTGMYPDAELMVDANGRREVVP